MTTETAAERQALEHFRAIARKLGRTSATLLLLGPCCDHPAANHQCCQMIFGQPGGDFDIDALSADTEGGLTLVRWAMVGMIAEVTEGAVAVRFFTDLEELTDQALAIWPAIGEERRRDKIRRGWDSGIVGHA